MSVSVSLCQSGKAMDKQLAIAATETTCRKVSRWMPRSAHTARAAQPAGQHHVALSQLTAPPTAVHVLLMLGQREAVRCFGHNFKLQSLSSSRSCLAYLCIYKWNQNPMSLRVACKACFSPSRASHSRSYAVVAFNSTRGKNTKNKETETKTI